MTNVSGFVNHQPHFYILYEEGTTNHGHSIFASAACLIKEGKKIVIEEGMTNGPCRHLCISQKGEQQIVNDKGTTNHSGICASMIQRME